MRIVGWTEWDDPDYKEMFPIGGQYNQEEIQAVKKIIVDELRANGFKFTGDYHQNGDYGVPIFDTGKVFQCTQRTWGAIMAEAYPDGIDNNDGYGYVKWAWIAPEQMVVPKTKG